MEHPKTRTGSINTHISQEQIKKEKQERKKSILHLISQYLKEQNLLTSFEALKKEAQLSDQFTVCDNIDLDLIVQEFQSYYHVKFQREAKIIRRVSAAEQAAHPTLMHKTLSAGKMRTANNVPNVNEREKPAHNAQHIDGFKLEIIPIVTEDMSTGQHARNSLNSDKTKPLQDFSGYTQEWREMADQIMKEFIPNTLGYSWEQCIGLEKPVELLKEATVYPLLYPELFKNLTSSWKGILLYGPPGTGKTLLAKSLASETNSNFINVTSSTFVSKWRGDSEKMIKVLFDLAKYYEPTTIFIDEIDALLSETKETNHEASCRFKSELLIQMDGLLELSGSVFLLATTNSPWKLDKALLRRFEKRILIPLPKEEAKIQILMHYAKIKNVNNNDLNNLIIFTENFSGSDIKNVCKEVEMSLVREQLKNLGKGKKKVTRRDVTSEDLLCALKSVKPSISKQYYDKILEWHELYGS